MPLDEQLVAEAAAEGSAVQTQSQAAEASALSLN